MGVWQSVTEMIGRRATAGDVARYARSPQWRDGRFQSPRPRVDGSMIKAALHFFFGRNPHRVPATPLPVMPRRRADFEVGPASGLRVTWLGHSTVLLEIDGVRLLVDPVWAERASGFSGVGPRRFFAPLIALDELPPLDLVLLSHDHYDHLDRGTVLHLAAMGVNFLAPLGVGSRLQRWGVSPTQINELDWWESYSLGNVTLTATPARHFSGRGLRDHGQSLWTGFAIRSPDHSVYYAGDSAMQDEFAEVGERLGPFELTMIEVGAYDALWADVHLGPEQAIRAHQLARGGALLPLHWGLFDLALHGWTEPIERTLVAAEAAGVAVVVPRPGEPVELPVQGPPERWWPSLPWRTSEEAPIRSSGVDHLFRPVKASGPAENSGADVVSPIGSAPLTS